MSILFFGSHSLLGEDLAKALKKEFTVEAHSRKDFDLTDLQAFKKHLNKNHYDVVVYAAGLTDPEACEKEKEKTMFLNVEIPTRLAQYCVRENAKLVYFSDALVFDGKKDTPYTEEDKPNPLSTYGKSRYYAECEIQETGASSLICRVGWPYGKKSKGIFKKIIQLLEEKGSVHLASNFYGSPIFTEDLAKVVQTLITRKVEGIVHLGKGEKVSWYEYAKEFIYHAVSPKAAQKVLPQEMDDSHLASTRPKNSSINSVRLVKEEILLNPWKTGMQEFCKRYFK